MGRVQDQVAIVTGAAKGLGEAIALRLAQDGAKLVMADIDGQGLAGTATAIREAGGEAVTVVGDITEEEPAAALIEAA
ncbi:MAG: SDR family NAD(P)-dependent oxidoreductase, partial [Rickettsiales bacterium]